MAQALETITGQSERLSRLLSRLLDISRLEGGKLALETRPTDLAALVERAVSDVAVAHDGHPIILAAPASLDHFLTERYCLYAPGRAAVPSLRAEIHHAPWPLQPARAVVARNTMARPLGIELSGAPAPPQPWPLLRFAAALDVVAWAPLPVRAVRPSR